MRIDWTDIPLFAKFNFDYYHLRQGANGRCWEGAVVIIVLELTSDSLKTKR